MRVEIHDEVCGHGIAEFYGKPHYGEISMDSIILVLTDTKPRSGDFFEVKLDEFHRASFKKSIATESACLMKRWPGESWQHTSFYLDSCVDENVEALDAFIKNPDLVLYGWIRFEVELPQPAPLTVRVEGHEF